MFIKYCERGPQAARCQAWAESPHGVGQGRPTGPRAYLMHIGQCRTDSSTSHLTRTISN